VWGTEVGPEGPNCRTFGFPGTWWWPGREKLQFWWGMVAWDWIGEVKNAGWIPLDVLTMQQLGGRAGPERERKMGCPARAF